MTLKQEQILGAKVRILRALLRRVELDGEPRPFEYCGHSKTTLDITALDQLIVAGLVERKDIPNVRGAGVRRAYIITPEGIRNLGIMLDRYTHSISH